MNVNVARNDELRRKVNELFDDYGVNIKFFTSLLEMDYGLFIKWKKGKKNYIDNNLDKIEKVLTEKYGMFKQVG